MLNKLKDSTIYPARRWMIIDFSNLQRAGLWVCYAVLSAFSLGVYVLASRFLFHPGFPLDDAWIHQTFARNLALHGEWSFMPGNISAGSTSPGWTVILALGYLLPITPLVWVYLTGWLLLTALAIIGALSFLRLSFLDSHWWILAGGFLIFEWHLVWAAVSGMETILAALFPLLVLLVAFLIERTIINNEFKWYFWFFSGLLVGFSIWIRPDGISLVVIPGFLLVTRKISFGSLKAGFFALIGFSLPVTVYIAMNFFLGNGIWPNTFYAKQAEYQILRENPFVIRYLMQAQLPLIGPGAILLPGFLWFVYESMRRRTWVRIAGVIWLLEFLGLYAWRLPVTYQHGRYIMPIMPMYFLMGMAGYEQIIHTRRAYAGKLLSLAIRLSLIGVSVGFWLLGAQTYATDVAIIESEMVASSLWIRTNTEPGSVIAAHDIGALGYFSERKIVDLAGLISPEVVPFVNNEEKLVSFLQKHHADYLMTFPGWYPELIKNGILVYSTLGRFSPMSGGENMAVFRLIIP